MNTLTRSTTIVRTTQAAEGVPRWRWTTEELVRLGDLGAFSDMDRFELIGGEIVPMSPVGRRHTEIADRLARRWTVCQVPGVHCGEEKQLNLDEATYTKVDVLVWPAPIHVYDVRGTTALLVVEVAHTSLRKDTGFKRRLHAGYGVRDYWVIDAEDLSTRVHRDPGEGGFGLTFDVASTDMLTPLLVPALALRLADLGIA